MFCRLLGSYPTLQAQIRSSRDKFSSDRIRRRDVTVEMWNELSLQPIIEMPRPARRSRFARHIDITKRYDRLRADYSGAKEGKQARRNCQIVCENDPKRCVARPPSPEQ